MNLTVWKDTGTTSYPICNNVANGSVGVITCNTSGQTGNLRGQVYRQASPSVLLVQKLFSANYLPFTSSWGLFFSFLIAIPIIFLFAMVSPNAVLLGGIISLIPAFYFGSINLSILGGFIIIAGLVGHLLKHVR